MDKAKRELIGIVMNLLSMGFKGGHITKEEYAQYMQEVKEMQQDSPEEIRALVELMIEERRENS